ncbi:hypothetical protein [Methanolobus halotolerans]|uniref:Uncharacterized protein n=1 Tax=Methanolobus halotolerans TaxID=2052935 RepID=A0A4E0Q2J4_9EURY|nr:hypothetical protein [Methanolobus halotolerans]TGC11429.1 hypothetical protein CUN85_00700 [Methanolobus halotolerans]
MKRDNRRKMVFALFMGFVYILFGTIQLITGSSKALLNLTAPENLGRFITDVLFIPPDAIGGFVLILMGSVFIYGFVEIHSGREEGIAYVYVGILLSLIFAGIYVLAAVGNILEVYILKNTAFADWSILDDIRPEIYLGFISLLSYLQWKDDFDIEND